MNYNLALKSHVENLTKVKVKVHINDLIRKGHAAYQSTCIVVLNISEVFSLPQLVSIKRNIAENCR